MKYAGPRPEIKRRYYAAGIGLIEILIALALGLVLTGGAIQIFSSSKQGYRLQEQVARLQENARFAMFRLKRDLRMAGANPCGATQSSNTLGNTSNWMFDFNKPVQGYDHSEPGDFPSNLVNVVAGTDALVILSASGGVGGKSYRVTKHNPSSARFDIADENHDLQEGDIVVICDRNSAAVFQLTGAQAGNNSNVVHNTGNTATPGNCTKKLGYPAPDPCSANAGVAKDFSLSPENQLTKLSAVAYYISTGPAAADVTADAPACASRCLYRAKLATDPAAASTVTQHEQLVEGVENMQVLYGNDSDNDGVANGYLTAAAVTDWNRIVSVRVGLLLQSPEEVASRLDEKTYAVAGLSIGHDTAVAHAADRRLRIVVGSTVRLRNIGCGSPTGC